MYGASSQYLPTYLLVPFTKKKNPSKFEGNDFNDYLKDMSHNFQIFPISLGSYVNLKNGTKQFERVIGAAKLKLAKSQFNKYTENRISKKLEGIFLLTSSKSTKRIQTDISLSGISEPNLFKWVGKEDPIVTVDKIYLIPKKNWK